MTGAQGCGAAARGGGDRPAIPRAGHPGQQQGRIVVEGRAHVPHQVVTQPVQQVAVRAAGPGGQPGYPLFERIELPARVPGLGDAVGVEQQRVTGLQRHGALRARRAAE